MPVRTQNDDFLRAMNERSQEIFKSLVELYLESGAPVGSRNLSRNLPMSLSPASVRNVMSDLEELGLIAAPHTSAGREPTQAGLRFFVDAMLEVGSLDNSERAQIDSQIDSSARDGNLESLLTDASQMLSGLCHGAGVVIASKSDMILRHIEFVQLDRNKAMAIMVGENNVVENRIITLPPGLTQSALVEANNFLGAKIVGKTLAQAQALLSSEQHINQAEIDVITKRLIDSGLASLIESEGQKPALIVRGRSNLLEDQMAIEDLERVRRLFDELETKKGLVDLLSDAEAGDGVRIFIGSENKLFSLSGSSVILSPYHNEQGNMVGVLGVIGPTRLNYARIVPVVDYTAQMISKLSQVET